jgi:hypothetical protein
MHPSPPPCVPHTNTYWKRFIHFQKFILQKLLILNPCPMYGGKGNLSKFWYESPARCAHNNSVCQGVLCSKWQQAYRRKLSACWMSVSSVQWYFQTRYGKNPPTRKSIYDWYECGKSWIINLTLPRHMWESHRVLVRCENNFESSPFSLHIAHHHSTCKINSRKCILLF